MNLQGSDAVKTPGLRLCTLLATAVLIASCGEAIDPLTPFIDPGSGGTGVDKIETIAIGPITGFGSIILNGVRYDDSAAQVVDDADRLLSRSQLRLGMTVQVQGAANRESDLGVADRIQVFSDLRGIVTNLNGNRFEINNVPVKIVPSTVIDAASGLVNGFYVEVFGAYHKDSESVIASRIELDGDNARKVRGPVSNWQPSIQQFDIKGLPVSYAGYSLPVGFAEGSDVRIWFVPSLTTVSLVRTIKLMDGDAPANTQWTELEGIVDSVGESGLFTMLGLQVDATQADVLSGALSDIRSGTKVQVEGEINQGRLFATEVRIKDDSEATVFELTGRVGAWNSINDFIVRNIRINAGNVLGAQTGSLSFVQPGVCVRATGITGSDSDGMLILASDVLARSDCP